MEIRDLSETYPNVIETALTKTREQVNVIRLNDTMVTWLFNQFGFDFSPLFPEQFYIVPTHIFRKLPNTNKCTVSRAIPYYGAVIIDARITDNPINFASVIRHEIIHLRGIMLYRKYLREGFGVGKKFRGLNEMFTEFTTAALNMEFLKNSTLLEEKKRYEKGIDKFSLNEESLREFLGADIYSFLLSWPEIERRKIITFFVHDFDNDGNPVTFGYDHLVKFFFCLLEEIEKNLNISIVSGIFPVFVRAYITGNLLPLGRMIEDSFGKGAFRLLGTMTSEDRWSVQSLYERMKNSHK